MSRPRVFISSTYFDLKHVRASLESFITNLGFDVVLSEKGKIAYSPDLPLDESCYKEAQASDILVLLIGGRYGSEATPRAGDTKGFFDRYNSITKKEYLAARDKGAPVYILIERPVYTEYETYLRNKDNEHIIYAHVDSINVFELIEEIISQPKNNPIFQFDKQTEIELWLREQWAGLFRELLQRMQSQQQIASLQSQVAQLSEINITLKRYLEAIVSYVAPTESEALIKEEQKRLYEAQIDQVLSSNSLANTFFDDHLTVAQLRKCLMQATSISDFLKLVSATPGVSPNISNFSDDEGTHESVKMHINEMREILNLEHLE